MLPGVTMAQADSKKHETIKVYFRQGSKNLDPKYMGNAVALEELASMLDLMYSTLPRVRARIHIMASASPEGSVATNNYLIEQRSQAIAKWMGKRFNMELGYEFDFMGIDWTQLIALVETTEGVPARDQVLDILHNLPAEQREARLAALNGGTPYKWMLARLYPKMRYAAVRPQIWYALEITITSPSPMYFEAEGGEGTITFQKNVEDMVVPTVTCAAPWITDIKADGSKITYLVTPNAATEARSSVINIECYGKNLEVLVHQKAAQPVVIPEPEPEPEVEPEPATEATPAYTRPFYMSISTNALYNLALIPNIGVEFYLGKNWSIDANWHYAWWKSDKRYRYWRTYGGDLALRKWFGKKAAQKPLTGHHAGLYGQMLTYDFEWGGRGYLADRWSYAAGIEYGYSLPIASRLNLDFNIGLGYHWGEYKEYLPIDDHYVWQATKNRKYMGPTKAEISLIWLIGNGNYNSKKGGNL